MTKVSILGYGTVGTGIIKLIDKNNNNIEVSKVLVRDKKKHINKKYYDKITEDFDEILDNDSDIIIEVIGGTSPAYEYIKKALKNKKNVITANKDVIAEYGHELFELAESNNVILKFEAAIAGGIPIVKAMIESLRGNEIRDIKAILNGTTNFILTQMDINNLTYNDALEKAQKLGFAESNPEADVEGYDAARKLAIISTIAFRNKVYWKDIDTSGITNLKSSDFELARNANCKIKLLAYSKKYNNKVYAKVAPVFVSNSSELYNVNNETNSVILDCDALGKISFIGNGAGMLPTASAVFNDLLDTIAKRNDDISILFKDKVEIEKFEEDEWKGILKINTTNEKETINMLENNLKLLKVSLLKDKNSMIVIGNASNENIVNETINKIKELPNVNEVKKFSIIA